MAFKLLLITFFTGWFNIINSQTYELLNEIYESDINLRNKFESWDQDFLLRLFDDDVMKQIWQEIPYQEVASFEDFISNINMSFLLNEIEKKPVSQFVDFNQLDPNYISVTETDFNEGKIESYLVITEPIFNKSKEFAIVYSYPVRPAYISSSGKLLIYRRNDGNKWTKYHSFTLWIN